MITYLPEQGLLGYALEDIKIERNPEKRMELFKKLADRIIEHSDELKTLEANTCVLPNL